jgi:hypothetical protein
MRLVGGSDACIATHPSDMAMVMRALDGCRTWDDRPGWAIADAFSARHARKARTSDAKRRAAFLYFPPSLQGANGSRECAAHRRAQLRSRSDDRLREAIHAWQAALWIASLRLQ